jgi:hypothetical protein
MGMGGVSSRRQNIVTKTPNIDCVTCDVWSDS